MKNWRNLLPSPGALKQAFYLIIIFLLLFLIFNNFKKTDEIKNNFEINKSYEELDKIKKMSNADTDGDGLEDWQEALYKTDSELIDTDGDGISDFDEINQDRDPLVFGIGKKQKILEINSVERNIATFEDQKRDMELYKEKLKKDLLLKLEKRREEMRKSEDQDLYKVEDPVLDFTQEKRDLNKIADSLMIYNSDSSIKDIMRLQKFFSVITDNKEKQELNEDDILYYKKIADLNIKVFRDLDNYSVENIEIQEIKKLLAGGYEKVGESLHQLIKDYETGSVDGRLGEIKKYGLGQKNIVLSRQKLHLFIKNYHIKFDNYDSGRMLEYSM